MLSRLSSREKNLILGLLVIALAFLFYKFILHGQILKNAELREVYTREEAQLEQSMQISNTLDKVTLEAKTIEKNLESVKARFVTKADGGNSEVKLGKDAKSDAVRVVLFQPLPVVQNPDYIELPIRMEVEGRYFAIIDFLTSIEGFFNQTEVKDLQIIDENKKKFITNPTLKLAFTFSIYTTNPPEEESSYSDLTQWTVGKLNSFTVSIRALAQWNPTKTEGSNTTPGTNVSAGPDGDSSGDSGDSALPPEGSNDLGILK